MTDGPTAPAGWYPQADGSQRYWDGTSWTPPTTSDDEADEAVARAKANNRWFFGVIAVILLVGGCTWASGRSGSQHVGPTDASVSRCESAVKAQLKSPSTAEFSDHRWGDRSGGGFILRGSVDSENGFGAMIRSTWICEINASGSLDGAPVVG
jgi:hypothetical protein